MLVQGTQNIQPLNDLLNKTAPTEYSIKSLHNEQVSIHQNYTL